MADKAVITGRWRIDNHRSSNGTGEFVIEMPGRRKRTKVFFFFQIQERFPERRAKEEVVFIHSALIV
jgi:hypothetical protein